MQKATIGPRKLTMTLIHTLHMNAGDEGSSYANNSHFQKTMIQKTEPILKRAIKDMANHDAFFDTCFMVADLGCSSGMNPLLVATNIIDTVHEVCQEYNRKTPQFQVCLNDLFGNDFNSVFKLLPNFFEVIKKDKGEDFAPCFVSAVPGSFYERLFPNESLHFVHSSYSLHWLSQVPKGLEDNNFNVHIVKSSPPSVLQEYGKQFHADFTKFLQLRSKEIVSGGRMVLAFRGRRSHDPTSDEGTFSWELLSSSLVEMFKEGLIQKSDIISFNFPLYFPHEDEVRNVIQADGSFFIDDMNIIELNLDLDDTNKIGKLTRAITESLFTSHFGESIIDVLFKKYVNKLAEMYKDYPNASKEIRQVNLVVSLNKIKDM